MPYQFSNSGRSLDKSALKLFRHMIEKILLDAYETLGVIKNGN